MTRFVKKFSQKGPIDFVVWADPHVSIREFEEIAGLVGASA